LYVLFIQLTFKHSLSGFVLSNVNNMSNRVIITGGTGLVGRALKSMLEHQGYTVSLLSRRGNKDAATYEWNPAMGTIDESIFYNHDYIIHLAGAGVADKRWTTSYKKEIYDSRIQSTQLLVKKMAELKGHHIKKFVSTSAIGIYGNDISSIATETTPAASNFLAKVCEDWESEALKAETFGMPTVIIRVGVVLAKGGGFIPQISAPIKLFAGTVLGTGKQMLSWIHIDDLCKMYVESIKRTDIKGIYNAVAPAPVSHNQITHLMAKRLHRPIILPNAPTFVLKLVLGEMHGMILANQHVSAGKWIREGFQFKFSNIEDALADLI
jgi:uncharacterized protein (TIGR01777 family)